MGTNEVTVAIPFTGGEQYLALAVNSVLRQTLEAWRLILIGDGPTEAAATFARTLSDPRIRYVHHETRQGLATRLNEAASLTETPFLARMDADDLMFPRRLQCQLELLKREPFDLVGSRAVAIDGRDRILGLYREGPLPTAVSGYLRSNAFTHPTVMGRTDWFIKNPYRNDLMRSQDMELWLRSSVTSTFAKVQEPLLFYRLPSTRRLRTYHASSAADRRIVRQYGPDLTGRTRTTLYLARSVAKEGIMATLGRSSAYVRLLDKQRVDRGFRDDWTQALAEAKRV